VIGCLHFINTGKYTFVTDDVVGNVCAILNGRVIAYIAGYNGTVSDSGGNAEVVMHKQNITQRADAYQSVKGRVADQGRLKGIAYKNIVPVATGIVVFDEDFPFLFFEAAPNSAPGRLRVSDPVFILSGRKVFGGYEAIPMMRRKSLTDICHVVFLAKIIMIIEIN